MSATTQLVLGVILIGGGVLVALVAVGLLSRPAGVQRSLAAVRALGVTEPVPGMSERRTPVSSRRNAARARMAEVAHDIDPMRSSSTLRRRLDLAGNPEGWDLERLFAWKLTGLLVLGLVSIGLSYLIGWSLGVGIVIGVGALLLGWFLPDLVLYQLGYDRTERIRRELPDALDLLTISVESGLSFDGAMAQVARNADGPLAGEFFRVLQEMQIGVDRVTAIRSLGERTNLSELRQFAAAMVQADSFGIPIANVLRVQAREMRVKRAQEVEERAQKVPVKILFPLIFCFLPTFLILVLGPAVVSIAKTFFGVGG